MKLSVQVGKTSKILNVFVQDAAVSTGAGLANVFGSTVSFSWWKDSQLAASTGVASTAGSMGVYSTSAWVQVSSSNALGWYQFGAPDGVFASGECAAIHFYAAPGMAPLPVEIELTRTNNQTYASSTVFLGYTSTSPANVRQIHAQSAVTSASGQFTVSTQTIDKTGYNATTTVNLDKLSYDITSTYSSALVTSAAGQFRVSTQTIDKTGCNATTTVNLDKAGYTATTATNLDKTGYDLTAGERATLAGVILTTTQPESFRSVNAEGSVVQLMYEVLANLTEQTNSGTTRALNSVTSHASSGLEYQYDSSTTPSTITRIA